MAVLKISWRALFALVVMILASSGVALAGQEAKPDTDVSEELSEAYQATKNYTFEKKDDFIAWGEKQAEELKSRSDKLEREISESSGEVRQKLESAWDDLRAKQKDLERELAEAGRSAPGAWEETKKGFSRAMDELQQAYLRAKEKFSEGAESSGK